MTGTISLATKNDLGVAEAKRRVSDGFAQLKADYLDRIGGTAEMTWEGDTAHVGVKALAQDATAQVAVTADEIKLEIQLPWLLAGFSGMIEALIRDRAGILRPNGKGEEPPPGTP